MSSSDAIGMNTLPSIGLTQYTVTIRCNTFKVYNSLLLSFSFQCSEGITSLAFGKTITNLLYLNLTFAKILLSELFISFHCQNFQSSIDGIQKLTIDYFSPDFSPPEDLQEYERCFIPISVDKRMKSMPYDLRSIMHYPVEE